MTVPSDRFVTTLHFPLRDEWNRRGDCLTIDDPPLVRRVWRILRRARAGVPVVLNGFSTADLIAALSLGLLRRRVPVIMTDATWQDRGGLDGFLTRRAIRLMASSRTIFCVSSAAEREHWPRMWGVPANQVTVVHWYHGIDNGPHAEPPAGDGRVFSGGHALRDYPTLLAAVQGVSAEVDIAADADDLPAVAPSASVRVQRLSREAFHRRLREASVVVVPLLDRHGRSAGQTTFLDAMALGGLVCVTDILGIAEHISHRQTGLLVPPGDVEALAAALAWALDPANADEVMRIRKAAQQTARSRFSPERFIETVLAVIDGVLADEQGRGGAEGRLNRRGSARRGQPPGGQ